MRPATTYSPNAELGVSTIGPGRLNGRVRNGNGCISAGNITDLTNLLNHRLLAEPAGVWLTTLLRRHHPGSTRNELLEYYSKLS